MAVRTGMAGTSVYQLTKTAIAGLVKGVALDLAPRGITVNKHSAGAHPHRHDGGRDRHARGTQPAQARRRARGDRRTRLVPGARRGPLRDRLQHHHRRRTHALTKAEAPLNVGDSDRGLRDATMSNNA
ncbi:hypothetical protein [Variovorax paradoxus]|uniref:hypothetical protein n=1 Tax=Variovorax paradoxus TaxID=34073 RepID=UPI0027D8544B|nr:hypothetical protein [Variovorax paradoxus]